MTVGRPSLTFGIAASKICQSHLNLSKRTLLISSLIISTPFFSPSSSTTRTPSASATSTSSGRMPSHKSLRQPTPHLHTSRFLSERRSSPSRSSGTSSPTLYDAPVREASGILRQGLDRGIPLPSPPPSPSSPGLSSSMTLMTLASTPTSLSRKSQRCLPCSKPQ